MGGLIPLLLPVSSSNRLPRDSLLSPTQRLASVMASHAPATTTQRRQQSLPAVNTPVKLTSVVPAPQQSLPDTAEDWRHTISEVKRKFIGRKYRSCSMRCVEILASLKDTPNVDTIYLVYLHFYAASSLEMSARPLSQSSTYRTSMLNDARDHYGKALELIQKAEEASIQKRPVLADLSMQSPSLSESSHETSSIFTAGSSPRSSVSSVEDLQDSNDVIKPQTKKKKKKVSFSGLPEILKGSDLAWRAEPFIRPDSPTLGWEENNIIFGQPDSLPEYVLTNLLAAPTPEPTPKQVEEPVVIATHKRSHSALKRIPPPTLKPVPEEQQEGLFDLESFLQAKAMNRIASQFSALRSQIAYHHEDIENLLAEVCESSETPDVPDVPALPALTHSRAGSTCSVSGDDDHDDDHLLSVPPFPGATMLSPNTVERALSQRLQEAFGNSSSFDLTLKRHTTGPSSEASISRRPSLSRSPPRSRSSSLFSLDEEEEEDVSPQQQLQMFPVPEATMATMEAARPWERSQRNSSLPGGTTIPAWTLRDRSNSLAANTAWSARVRSSSIIVLPSPYLEGSNTDLCPGDRTRSSSIASLTSSYSTRPPSAASSTTSHGSRASEEALQARIDRLRASGWQRKRFDSRRYEALREQVLSELDTP